MAVKLQFSDAEGFDYEVESEDGEDTGGYMKGMLQLILPLADWPIRVKEPTVYLPHSCGKWVIGGAEEVKLMIADLESALVELSKTEK